jgi:hypothetical protein
VNLRIRLLPPRRFLRSLIVCVMAPRAMLRPLPA